MKIICIGRNYSEHIRELKNETPEEPVIFIKPDSAVLRNNSPFFIPAFTQEVHYEVEVFVKIKKHGKAIPEKFAATYYDEVGLGIDFTARDLQNHSKTKGLPWEKAKGFDHSAVIGKTFPKSEFQLDNQEFSLKKNGVLVQQGNTRDMIYSIDAIIAYVSQFFTLKKGDLIFTGTPSGVGPVQAGDQLEGFLGNHSAFRFDIR
ncbi:MAG: fumarylacetoacetate hydrolase family protein [Bacteroidetes bacterium]|nr:fumarylacetoacetate hydrolase family protein [Bacteroidota bacterium]